MQARARELQAEQAARATQVVFQARFAQDGLADIEEVGIPMVNTVEMQRKAKVRRRSLRRARAATSLLLLVGVIVAVVGVVVFALGATAVPLVAGLVATIVAFGVLAGLARAGRAAQRAVTAPVATSVAVPEFFDHAESDALDEQYAEEATWTPQPLPKPLHLSEGTRAASAMASIDAAKELQRAVVRATLEARAAELVDEDVAALTPRRAPVAEDETEEEVARGATSASVPQFSSASAPSSPSSEAKRTGPTSRFARMGVIDGLDDAKLDVDAVLRRRRAS